MELKYGKGSATGVLSEDTIILGGRVDHVVFGEMTNVADMDVCSCPSIHARRGRMLLPSTAPPPPPPHWPRCQTTVIFRQQGKMPETLRTTDV